MSLSTLRGIDEIDGFEILNHRQYLNAHPEHRTPTGINPKILKGLQQKRFIEVNDKENKICLTIQHGTVKEKGKNGIRIQTIIALAIAVLKMLNNKFHSDRNIEAIEFFQKGIDCLNNRQAERKG